MNEPMKFHSPGGTLHVRDDGRLSIPGSVSPEEKLEIWSGCEEPLTVKNCGTEIFHVTPEGDIVVDGEVITNNDAALGAALKRLLREMWGVNVRA